MAQLSGAQWAPSVTKASIGIPPVETGPGRYFVLGGETVSYTPKIYNRLTFIKTTNGEIMVSNTTGSGDDWLVLSRSATHLTPVVCVPIIPFMGLGRNLLTGRDHHLGDWDYYSGRTFPMWGGPIPTKTVSACIMPKPERSGIRTGGEVWTGEDFEWSDALIDKKWVVPPIPSREQFLIGPPQDADEVEYGGDDDLVAYMDMTVFREGPTYLRIGKGRERGVSILNDPSQPDESFFLGLSVQMPMVFGHFDKWLMGSNPGDQLVLTLYTHETMVPHFPFLGDPTPEILHRWTQGLSFADQQKLMTTSIPPAPPGYSDFPIRPYRDYINFLAPMPTLPTQAPQPSTPETWISTLPPILPPSTITPTIILTNPEGQSTSTPPQGSVPRSAPQKRKAGETPADGEPPKRSSRRQKKGESPPKK